MQTRIELTGGSLVRMTRCGYNAFSLSFSDTLWTDVEGVTTLRLEDV
jgi:hypothetical protein